MCQLYEASQRVVCIVCSTYRVNQRHFSCLVQMIMALNGVNFSSVL